MNRLASLLAALTVVQEARAWSNGVTCSVSALERKLSACRRIGSIRLEEEGDDFEVEYQPSPPPPTAMAGPGMSPCSIKVIGVGGGGGNTLNRMVADGPGAETTSFLEYVAANTDVQALSASLADTQVQLGKNSARGLGAGGMPTVGRASAIDATGEIEALVSGTDMVFVTAGMGGGTGSGAAPVVAELAKQAGCLTVGIVTKPFTFEGAKRTKQALDAIDDLQRHVDILIVVSNDKLLEIVPDGVPLQDAFSMADEILRQGITGISDIVVKPGQGPHSRVLWHCMHACILNFSCCSRCATSRTVPPA